MDSRENATRGIPSPPPPNVEGAGLEDALNSELLWEVATIAAFIGRSRRQTFHMIETGALPAKKVGGKWVASRKALRAFFATVMEDA